MSAIPIISDMEHNRMVTSGYANEIKKEIFYDCEFYDVILYSKDLSIKDRVGQFAIYGFFSLITCCCLPICNKNFGIQTFIEPLSGQQLIGKKKYNHEKTMKYYEELSKGIGFNPYERDSIIKYLKTGKNLEGFHSHLGHSFKPFFYINVIFLATFFFPQIT